VEIKTDFGQYACLDASTSAQIPAQRPVQVTLQQPVQQPPQQQPQQQYNLRQSQSVISPQTVADIKPQQLKVEAPKPVQPVQQKQPVSEEDKAMLEALRQRTKSDAINIKPKDNSPATSIQVQRNYITTGNLLFGGRAFK
jgi:hypothetical protein